MFCPRCKSVMKQEKGNRSFHKNKKFCCPKCGLIRMKKPKKNR